MGRRRKVNGGRAGSGNRYPESGSQFTMQSRRAEPPPSLLQASSKPPSKYSPFQSVCDTHGIQECPIQAAAGMLDAHCSRTSAEAHKPRARVSALNQAKLGCPSVVQLLCGFFRFVDYLPAYSPSRWFQLLGPQLTPNAAPSHGSPLIVPRLQFRYPCSGCRSSLLRNSRCTLSC